MKRRVRVYLFLIVCLLLLLAPIVFVYREVQSFGEGIVQLKEKLSDNIKKRAQEELITYFDSIPKPIKERAIKVPLDFVKNNLLVGYDVNFSIYDSSEVFLREDYESYEVFISRLGCSAGGDCGAYYLSVLDSDLVVKDVLLIGRTMAEGESNIVVLDDFKFADGKITFTILFENYDVEQGKYIERNEKAEYTFSQLGKIMKLE